MEPVGYQKGRAIEIALLGLVAIVVFYEGLRFVTTLSHSIGAVEAGAYLLALGAILGTLLLVYAFQKTPDAPVSRETDDPEADGSRQGIRDALVGIGLFFVFALLLHYTDYAIATFLFMGTYLRIFGRYRWPIVILVAAFVAVGSAYLWNLLGVPMPTSEIFTI